MISAWEKRFYLRAPKTSFQFVSISARRKSAEEKNKRYEELALVLK